MGLLLSLLGIWGVSWVLSELGVFGQDDEVFPMQAREDELSQGTDGDDQIEGSDGDDIIASLAGNDRVFGAGGHDEIDGGDGNDFIRGASGKDGLSGGSGNDTIFGDTGNDYLWGNSGNDSLNGGTGDDDLIGGLGADTIEGGSGHDFFLAGEGDLVVGGEDNDFIYTDGESELTGGPGEDMFIAEYFMDSINPVTITDFEPGVDRLIVTPTNGSLGVTTTATLDVADISQIFPSPWGEKIGMPADFQLRVVHDSHVSYLTNSSSDGTEIYIGATKVAILEGVLPNEIAHGDITLTIPS
jgi:Ca2+-binding RTX toxin-like protein